ncbi:tRNA(Met) cytidine acetyltransferase [Alteromonas sediminis]|uniref:tRNA(Met) cytidine acetyltransferase n=1 Tax=Alteromonas sediminis TaxID=2259342 RepID=A0A3N5XW68_9ALTE|nr:GNAT family N-acetyltransferase [Alteromonas sediminis]RPJ65057.1 tRNA(Met) cytidine acetyltransferase [Alteromonas sediminis]
MALMLCSLFGQKHLWLGDDDFFTSRGYPVKQYQKCLGVECDIAIYDGQSYFNASAFLALSGTVRRHGLLVLCVPHLSEWSGHHARTEQRLVSYGSTLTESQFIKRWIAELSRSEGVAIYPQGSEHLATLPITGYPFSEDQTLKEACFASADQARLYNLIIASDHGCHVITARRGRGKSALMGLIASFYAKKGRHITLCSPLKGGCDTLLKYYNGPDHAIQWVPPDSPRLSDSLDVLIIDEIASLPVPTSLRISQQAALFLVGTTVEGYEGTGKGFTNKLLPKLKEIRPKLQVYKMETPVRYYPSDSLEQHLTDIFMLKSPPGIPCPGIVNINNVYTRILKQDSLINSADLPDIIGILTDAHYKTSPEDTMRILDMPDTLLLVSYFQDKPIAAAVIIVEGGQLLRTLSHDIACGERRLKGHLLPQSMALLLSEPEAATLTCWRINRIAVSPKWQNQGIGSLLLRDIEGLARQRHIEILGTAFGYTAALSSFWEKARYKPIRLGQKTDAASGEKSTTCIKALSPNRRNIQSKLEAVFASEMSASFDHISTEVIAVYQARILDYINGTRSLHHLGKAPEWYIHVLKKQGKFINSLLSALWCEKCEEIELIKRFKYKGRKELFAKVKQAFEILYWQHKL